METPTSPVKGANLDGDIAGPGVVLVFDGKGGVSRPAEGASNPSVPARGFYVVSGNSRAPEFKVWLKDEIGAFNADLLTVPSSRARCTVLDDKAIVVMRVARPGAEPEDIGRQLMSLWLEKGRVIIASELNVAEFMGVSQWEQAHHAPTTPAELICRLGVRATDRLEPLVEMLGERLDAIEEDLIVKGNSEISGKLAQLRRTLINFRRLVWPLREVLNTLEIEDLSFFSARDRMKLREASGRAARLAEELQGLSERAVLVHEQIIDGRAEDMNQTMLLLTAVTVVFMPLTLITGALGMNVEGIPLAHSPFGFVLVCSLMVILSLGLIWWMRRRHWL